VLELVKRADQGRYRKQALAGKSLFLTNAVRGIVPIASLDGAAVPADPRTTELDSARLHTVIVNLRVAAVAQAMARCVLAAHRVQRSTIELQPPRRG